ncbi:MAG: tyrosine-type recombinase/integrase [Clostridiales bacterium]
MATIKKRNNPHKTTVSLGADYKKIRRYSLRHTNATLQIANGVPITTVAGGLGHATPSTTTKIYSHEIKYPDAAAPKVLENILTPNQSMAKSYFSADGRQMDGKTHKMQ